MYKLKQQLTEITKKSQIFCLF